MGILKRLFGKKKKESESETPQVKSQNEGRDVSLEDVEKGLDDLETVEKDKSVEEEKPATKTGAQSVPKTQKEPGKESEKTPSKSAEKEAPAAKSDDNHYHIKKHSKGWQVIEDGADKAYRVFQYQKEAIDFAKSENLEYTIFKADGTPRTE